MVFFFSVPTYLKCVGLATHHDLKIMSISGTFVTNVPLMDIFNRHSVESDAQVSYFPFRGVGRFWYILLRPLPKGTGEKLNAILLMKTRLA